MRSTVLLGLSLCAALAAADAPYAGTWKMNNAKSDFGETTVAYEQLPGGKWKVIADGQSFISTTDGKEVATPWGTTSICKALDANTWEVTEKVNGKTTAVSKIKVSADGKMLNVDTKRNKADGGTSNDTATFERVSGTTGFAGKWKTRKMNSSSPSTMTLTAKADGVEIAVGDAGGACNAKFDGKDYPATGKMWPSGWTCKVAKSGAHGLDVAWRKDGKDMYKATMTASADGKMLTESASAAGTTEKVKIVYDRVR